MEKHLLVLALCICSLQLLYSQEDDGVVALALPIRNSLTFNRFAMNPTFSFVREQTKYISIYNKREWTGFDDAPLNYLASYSGRFGENIGAGLGLFQQNYGVLTTFGGILNFAYNVRLERESNLTFGLNIGAYKSGINTGNTVTNFADPSLQNIPENFLITVNSGINYGTEFLDFGLSINNAVTYNFESSLLIEDNPEQSIQGHIMHTEYINTKGFFDESKFSGLLRSEFKQDVTVVSAIAMITVPKGIWAQMGYNTQFGVSGGIGLNITEQIALEYNYEKALGDLANFGSSHEITLAYRFKNNENYDYSRADDVSGLISTDNKKVLASKAPKRNTETQKKQLAEQKAIEAAEAQAKLVAEQEAIEAAKAQAKLVAEQEAIQAAETQAKLVAEQEAIQTTEAQAKLVAEQEAIQAAETQVKLVAEQEAIQAAEVGAITVAEEKVKEETEVTEIKEITITEEEVPSFDDSRSDAMTALAQETEAIRKLQDELLQQYETIVNVKDQDLKDLKEENDLSEQGITVKPKQFKNTSEENVRLNNIKSNLDAVIAKRDQKIAELKKLYEDVFESDTIVLDEVYIYYRKKINRLEAEQEAALSIRKQLENRLEAIKVATVFERNRRIKRAAFDNDEDRYSQDRATLENIKTTTDLLDTPLQVYDFDFGEELSGNIQILKNIQNTESGYYQVIAVHSNVEKRNKFIKQLVASGQKDIDFFYDVNTSKYYIYNNKYQNINDANRAMKTDNDKPYNAKMSLIKIDN